MGYGIVIVIVLFVLYKVVIALGRKNAKDVLVANYGLDRGKLDKITDVDITKLTISLDSLARRGDAQSLSTLLNRFR